MSVIPVGSPALNGAFNPFDESIAGSTATLPFVYAPAASGGDDLAMIQALVNTYNPLAIPVLLRQGAYLTSAEIQPAAGSPLRLHGAGHVYGSATKGTSIKLTAAARSVAPLTQPYSWICGIRLDANRLGTYGIYVQGGVGSHLIDGATTNALLDGIHCSPAGLNQAIEVSGWFSYENGKLYATAGILGQYAGITSALVRQAAISGTAATIAGDQVIVFTGAPDLTTKGIRLGDVLRVGSVALTAYFGQIKSVTANTIVVEDLTDNRPLLTAAGLDYAIGIGWGWFEELNGDGGFCYLDHSWFRSNGAGGIFANSLYGDKITDSLCDFNCSAGIALGICYNDGSMREPFVSGVYIEGGIGPDYILGNVLDGHIINPGGGGVTRIFSICGSQSQIAIHRHGRVESAQLGARQNFLLEYRNNGGTIEHRIVAEHWSGFASLEADKIIGASAAWTVTPTVDATHDFATGAGLFDSGAGLEPILKVAVDQNFAIGGAVAIEFNSSGTSCWPSVTTVSLNVNGTTRIWPVMFLVDVSGAIVPISTATLAAGKSIGIRFGGGYLK